MTFDVRVDPIGSELIWTWTTEIRRREDPSAVAARMRQSTFRSLLFSRHSLRKRAASFAPTLSPAGELALEVLEGIRTGRTVGQIAEELRAVHPRRFPSLDEAHAFVADLSERYGR